MRRAAAVALAWTQQRLTPVSASPSRPLAAADEPDAVPAGVINVPLPVGVTSTLIDTRMPDLHLTLNLG